MKNDMVAKWVPRFKTTLNVVDEDQVGDQRLNMRFKVWGVGERKRYKESRV